MKKRELLRSEVVKDLKNVKVLNLPEVPGDLHLEALVNQATLEIQYLPREVETQAR